MEICFSNISFMLNCYDSSNINIERGFMKKKLFSILLAMLLFVPFFVNAKEDKVKVKVTPMALK